MTQVSEGVGCARLQADGTPAHPQSSWGTLQEELGLVVGSNLTFWLESSVQGTTYPAVHGSPRRRGSQVCRTRCSDMEDASVLPSHYPSARSPHSTWCSRGPSKVCSRLCGPQEDSSGHLCASVAGPGAQAPVSTLGLPRRPA